MMCVISIIPQQLPSFTIGASGSLQTTDDFEGKEVLWGFQ